MATATSPPRQRAVSPRKTFNLVLISAALLLSHSAANALISNAHMVAKGGRSRTQTTFLPRYASLQNSTFHHQFPHSAARGKGVVSASSTRKSSFWSPSKEKSSPLQVRRRVRSALDRVRNRGSSSLHQTSSDGDSSTSTAEKTWSRPSEKSSSLGVRKRVKAVLKKAKSRTGIDNYSDEQQQGSAGLWVAEVASIGGLAEESDLVLKENKNNGIANGAASSSKKANGVNGVKVRNNNGASSSTSSSKSRVPSVMDLEVQRKNTLYAKPSGRSSNSSELDGLRGDVPTVSPEPLPFSLPKLSKEQERILLSGERVQEQSKMGREGSGYVVMDVKAPPYVIWECLLDFEKYPELIKTVRSMEMFTSNKLKAGYHAEKPVPAGTNREIRHYGIPSVTRAAFVLSKFKLNIAAIHNYRPHPDGHYMVFNLDPECTNIVLQSAEGIWYTQNNPDGRGEEYTRVWLLCSLKVSSLLPKFIVDYTAKRAMPRATNWLKPHVEPLAEQWAKEHEEDSR